MHLTAKDRLTFKMLMAPPVELSWSKHQEQSLRTNWTWQRAPKSSDGWRLSWLPYSADSLWLGFVSCVPWQIPVRNMKEHRGKSAIPVLNPNVQNCIYESRARALEFKNFNLNIRTATSHLHKYVAIFAAVLDGVVINWWEGWSPQETGPPLR